MYKNITGIILSGGKSSRMGVNKSFMKLGDYTVIERVVKLMQSLFTEVILITNTPDEYKFLNIPMYEDLYKHKGPIAGIHSGLLNSKTENNFIISCDIPLMTHQIIKYLIDFETEHPITVCRADGFIQQLAGKYSKSLLSKIESILETNEDEVRNPNQKKRKCNVLSLLDLVGAEIVEAKNLDFYKDGTFLNMNRQEDYDLILEKINLSPK
ncbi:MAG: molybdenum cofactor guanylyltransferase [Melioribacteraceae bacterium]|jgi:molybdopterin-guanine dinucleotide biosynthesis protein A|nr:molybdenum cofactor guanylyltransferase [Melioribacteraceae bacterium]